MSSLTASGADDRALVDPLLRPIHLVVAHDA